MSDGQSTKKNDVLTPDPGLQKKCRLGPYPEVNEKKYA